MKDIISKLKHIKKRTEFELGMLYQNPNFINTIAIANVTFMLGASISDNYFAAYTSVITLQLGAESGKFSNYFLKENKNV